MASTTAALIGVHYLHRCGMLDQGVKAAAFICEGTSLLNVVAELHPEDGR